MTKDLKLQYRGAPLPFQGQKRRLLNHFVNAIGQYPDELIFVDLFGGSGLLSHTAKKVRPECHVVYNDFDNFSQRLRNIPRTNRILTELRAITAPYPPRLRLPDEVKQKILELFREEEKTGFVDYITLSSSVLFSMNYKTTLAGFETETLYNEVRGNDYNASGYLAGVEVVSEDYKDIFNRYKDDPSVVFIVDPPYLSTDTGTYNNYWKLADYLDVLNVLKDTNYIYFTSHKSNVIELCDWIQKNQLIVSPFMGAEVREVISPVVRHTKYRDIMLYKKK